MSPETRPHRMVLRRKKSLMCLYYSCCQIQCRLIFETHSAALSLAVVSVDVEAYADAFAGESSLFEVYAVETCAVDVSAGGASAERLSTVEASVDARPVRFA